MHREALGKRHEKHIEAGEMVRLRSVISTVLHQQSDNALVTRPTGTMKRGVAVPILHLDIAACSESSLTIPL